jgi:hypothetical protein
MVKRKDCGGHRPPLQFMMLKFFTALLWVVVSIASLAAQEKVYPIREDKNDVNVLLTPDRTGISIQKPFQHKTTLSFPSDHELEILPDTKTPIIVLSMRIQNVSQRPFNLDPAKFTITDEEGKVYSGWTAAQAADRILAGASSGSLGSKTLRGISLGRVGSNRSEEDVREDILRYGLPVMTLPPGSVKEGLIFFEGPTKKKFTVRLSLGDLWLKPLPFSTEKQK